LSRNQEGHSFKLKDRDRTEWQEGRMENDDLVWGLGFQYRVLGWGGGLVSFPSLWQNTWGKSLILTHSFGVSTSKTHGWLAPLLWACGNSAHRGRNWGGKNPLTSWPGDTTEEGVRVPQSPSRACPQWPTGPPPHRPHLLKVQHLPRAPPWDLWYTDLWGPSTSTL
jgi:hypothetical protein